MSSSKNYYLTLLLCSLFGMFGAHLFYLARYKDGIIRILQTFVLVGIFFWLRDFNQLYFRGGFLDGEGKALPKYSEWYAKNPLNKYQKKMFQESKDHFAEAKRNFAEAKQHFSDAKKQLSEAKEIFLEPFKEKELDNKDNFAEAKRNFAEAKQRFSDAKKQLSEAKEIFLEPFKEKELDNMDSDNK